MEDPRRPSSSEAARRRRLHRLLTLAGEYIKYLFMSRRRLLGRVARRTLAAALSYHGGGEQPYYLPTPPAVMEHEFSFSDSPRRPAAAFLAAVQSRLRSGAGAGAADVYSCFGNLGASRGGSPEEVVEEGDDGWMDGEVEVDVDYRAEEFISMFYEQLRAQSSP